MKIMDPAGNHVSFSAAETKNRAGPAGYRGFGHPASWCPARKRVVVPAGSADKPVFILFYKK
jgi:hypothetical protein